MLAIALSAPGCKLLSLRRAEKSSAPSGVPCVGQTAPEIDGEDMAGNRMSLTEHRGKVVVVVFWASWCKPCRDMIPHERDLYERHRGKPFVLLGVNNDENQEAASKVIASQKMTWPIWKTTGAHDAINERWGVKSWPAVFVLDAKGVVRHVNVRGPQLENAVETLLAEMK
jgi:thiol-disulfide isomerase/thioredoxin